jgi:excisionase family DNA binding protein
MVSVERLLLKPSEAAEAMGLSRRKICALLAVGEVPFVRIGSSIRVSVEALKVWRERESGTCIDDSRLCNADGLWRNPRKWSPAGDRRVSPEIQAFIDHVIVPALVERFTREGDTATANGGGGESPLVDDSEEEVDERKAQPTLRTPSRVLAANCAHDGARR